MISPIYGENYNLHYGFASFKDKSILDLGADHGSSVDFFFKHGAKYIVAVEGDHDLFLKLSYNFNTNPNVLCIENMIKSSHAFIDLLESYNPDLVKIDIEGDEKYLLDIPTDLISKINEWLIETHTVELFDKFTKLFTSLEYKLSFHYRHVFPTNQIDVIWARKEPLF